MRRRSRHSSLRCAPVGQPVPARRCHVHDDPPIDTGQVRYGAARHRGIAKGHHGRRNIARDNGPSSDERARANTYEWQNGDIDANLRSGPDPGTGHQLGGAAVTRVEVVGDRHSRREKDVVFEFAVLGDVAIAVDFYPVPDTTAVIDDAVGPDRDVIAYFAAFPDYDAVPGLKAPPYRRAVVEHGSGAEPGPGTEYQRLHVCMRHGVADERAMVGHQAIGPRSARGLTGH